MDRDRDAVQGGHPGGSRQELGRLPGLGGNGGDAAVGMRLEGHGVHPTLVDQTLQPAQGRVQREGPCIRSYRGGLRAGLFL